MSRQKKSHRVFVRQPVHRAGEDQTRRETRRPWSRARSIRCRRRWDDPHRLVAHAPGRAVRTSRGRPPRPPGRRRTAAARCLRSASIRRCCAPYSHVAAIDRDRVSACRRQISASTLCVKSTAGHGSAGGRLTAGTRKSQTTRSNGCLRQQRLRASLLIRARSVLADGVRQRVDEVRGGVDVEARAIPWRVRVRGTVTTRSATSRMPVEVCRESRRRLGERQIGDLVAPREVAHQVPRAQLAALVERQQQVRLQPENPHGCRTYAERSGAARASGRRRRR